MRSRSIAACVILCGLTGLTAFAQDWPMWGGAPERNLTSALKGLPESWDAKNGTGIKWKAQLGTSSNGNPV